MSPELIAPQRFGFKNSRPTKFSDCYALGMVIYETISGNLPFHKHTDPTVIMKVLEGERPPRGAGFARSLWEMLELCWTSQSKNRPNIENVLQCLEIASNSSEPPSPGVDEEMEEEDDWDLPNGTNDTMTIEKSVTVSPGLSCLTGRPPSPVSTAPEPSIEVIVEDDSTPASGHITPSNIVLRKVRLPPVNRVHWSLLQAHSQNSPQQLGRPLSQPSIPGQGIITNLTPSMDHRLPPGKAPPSIDKFQNELMRIPNMLLPRVEQEVSVPQDKDFTTMTAGEKVYSRMLQLYLFIYPSL